MMNDKHWDMLSDLIERVVEGEPGDTWQEKAKRLWVKMAERGSRDNLEEIVNWTIDLPEE